jgi:hypothetical protein
MSQPQPQLTCKNWQEICLDFVTGMTIQSLKFGEITCTPGNKKTCSMQVEFDDYTCDIHCVQRGSETLVIIPGNFPKRTELIEELKKQHEFQTN